MFDAILVLSDMLTKIANSIPKGEKYFLGEVNPYLHQSSMRQTQDLFLDFETDYNSL